MPSLPTRYTLSFERLASEAVIRTPNTSEGWRGEVRRAADGLCVAISFQERSPRAASLSGLNVIFHPELGIPRLKRRVDRVPRDHAHVSHPAENDAEMIRRVARSRQQPYMIVDRIVASDEPM